MSRRNIALTFVVLASLICLAGAVWSALGKSRLVFAQTEIQDRLNRQLPRTVKGVTIERVDVALANDRVALQATLQGQVIRQPIAAQVSARGAPRYDKDSHEIYFDADSIAFDRIAVAGRTISPGGDSRNPLVATALMTAQQLAEQAVKAYLATLPVYRFKDDLKGFVLKAALSDVNVAGDRLVVDLSLWTLTTTTAVFAFWLLVGLVLIVLILRGSLWGALSGISIGDS
mgnify:CR=1 FL=1